MYCRRPSIVQKSQGIDDTSFFPFLPTAISISYIDEIFKMTYTGRNHFRKMLIHQRFLGLYLNYEELKLIFASIRSPRMS
jgi:hypothetical protein